MTYGLSDEETTENGKMWGAGENMPQITGATPLLLYNFNVCESLIFLEKLEVSVGFLKILYYPIFKMFEGWGAWVAQSVKYPILGLRILGSSPTLGSTMSMESS